MAALSSMLSTNIGSKKLCMFEIRLDENFIVFRGPENETPPTSVKGSVVLITTETTKTTGIKISLEGKRRTQHFITRPESHTGLPATSMITNKKTFMLQEHRFTDNRGMPIRVLPPGNHEFAFEFPLAGDTAESIEGMAGNYIVYDLKAVAERGMLAKDLTARRHLRIIRTLGPDSMDGAVASAVHGVWPEKLKYVFEPTTKNVIFGTSVSTELELTPLIEKLGIEKVKFTLKETRRIKTEPGPDYSATTSKWTGSWREESDVFTDSMTLPEACDEIDQDTQLPMFKFTATWNLPKSLTQCRQSVEEGEWITIKHSVHYDILLRNPDGHLSELKAHYPARLFISPHLPVGENNSVSSSPNDMTTNDIDPLDTMTAPPTYGSHQLDQLIPLYDGIDPTGFSTPGVRSGAATPFRSQIGNESVENLATLNDPTYHGANPNALQMRLRNLQFSDSGESNGFAHRHTHHSPSGDNSPPAGNLLEQRRSITQDPTEASSSPHTNGFFSSEEAEHADYDMNALGRMPSYNTAVKTHARVTKQGGLPTYARAISRPSSPPLQPPRQAHIRSGHLTPE